MAADTNITLALLDAIWRAFDETKRSRIHTSELLSELLDMDEGRWREARHGQPITAYYLRDNLGGLMPSTPRASLRAAGVKAPRISNMVMTFCTSKRHSSAIWAKDCPVRARKRIAHRTTRKMIQMYPPHPSHPPHWLEKGYFKHLR